jgi:hypothetical protein
MVSFSTADLSRPAIMRTQTLYRPAHSGRLSRQARVALLWAAAGAIALAAWLLPPFAQPEAYHQFADRREMLGISNALDVASNLAFLLVGVMGLVFVVRGRQASGRDAFIDSAERWAWGVAFLGTALTCCGSGYYHLDPDSPRLAWDRLPMAIGFTGIVAAVVSERVSATAGRWLLVPLVAVGIWSVWYWRWSVANGAENLNPYGAVQFGSMVIILLALVLFPARYTRGADFVVAVLFYGLAKVGEHFDKQIFALTGGLVSGHTLKHLLAAVAIGWLLRMLTKRTPVPYFR